MALFEVISGLSTRLIPSSSNDHEQASALPGGSRNLNEEPPHTCASLRSLIGIPIVLVSLPISTVNVRHGGRIRFEKTRDPNSTTKMTPLFGETK